VRFVRERPLLGVGLAVLHYPILMGLWVMASETLSERREALARLLPSKARRLVA